MKSMSFLPFQVVDGLGIFSFSVNDQVVLGNLVSEFLFRSVAGIVEFQ